MGVIVMGALTIGLTLGLLGSGGVRWGPVGRPSRCRSWCIWSDMEPNSRSQNRWRLWDSSLLWPRSRMPGRDKLTGGVCGILEFPGCWGP